MAAHISTPFGFSSTAMEVIKGIDLHGKRAIITGGGSGIGVETAQALAYAGAEVTLAVRDTEKGEQVATRLKASTGNEKIRVGKLDVADLVSVHDFAKAWNGPLHILVNNAGIMAVPELERTPQGHELQFGTNYLGHFALTVGLHASLAAASGARVVSLSSNAHMYAQVDFDDPDFQKRPYHPMTAYAQSKVACVLLAVGVTQRWSKEGIYANALHPGAIATGLQKYTGGLQAPVDKRKTPEQGAATSIVLAASPLVEGIGGRYFENGNEAAILQGKPEMFGGGVSPYALDPINANKLWNMATELMNPLQN